MSSPQITQELQASTLSSSPPSQALESPLPAQITDSRSLSKTSSTLVSTIGGQTAETPTRITSAPSSDTVSSSTTALTASMASSPQTVRPIHGSVNIPLQNSVSTKFVSSTGYGAPAPSFSYNVMPRVNPAAAPPQQSATATVLRLTPPVPAAALQPPVPGQPFMNRPSFSYNVFPQANASSASGQQLRPSIATSQVPLQGVKLTPPVNAASLQPPVPGQPMRPGGTVPGTFAQNIPRPVGQVLTSSNFSFGKSVQSTAMEASDKTLIAKDCASNTEAEVGTRSADSVQTSSSMPVSSKDASSSYPPLFNMMISTSPSVAPRPGMSTTSGTTESSVLSSSSAAQAIVASSPSHLGPMPFPAAPSSLASGQMPPPQNVQPQIYSPYPSVPAISPNTQAPWQYPPVAGGLQNAPLLPYPSVYSPFAVPMRGVSVPVVPSPNVQHSGVSAALPSDTSTSSGSNPASKLTADQDNQANNHTNDGRTSKIEEVDVWTAHKTDTGVIYYYNSVTGESTYEKPSSFKGEPEKVADKPTRVTWEKIEGTNWSLITTHDGKKYYYDNQNKVSSWQVPPEVAEKRKIQENDSSKVNSAQEEGTDDGSEKVSVPVNVSNPATYTSGPDSARSSGGQVSSSALDLIKKKLQEAGSPVTSTGFAPTTMSNVSELNVPKAVDAVAKVQQSLNSKDKVKDANGEGNLSDSSSDSDDGEKGPTKEECIIKFKEMLKERGVAPFSKWEKELPKIVFDPRFKAVPSYSTRRSIFEHFVRTRAEEERKEKRAAQKAAIDGFKQLLEEASEDIDDKTDYQSFKRKWGKDPRFEALDRKERELLLNEKIIPLRKAAEDKIKAIRTAAITSFKSMLRENKEITVTSRWSKVKDSLRSDPRYRSVKHEERELLFDEYISELKAAEAEAERAAKAKRDEQDKLKERERETRKRKEREEHEMERIKLKVRRKEAISSYQALLVETIKDPKASWTESKPKLEKDPQARASNPDLSEDDMEKLFRDHVKDLFERCARDYRSLLAEVMTVEAAARVIEDGKNVLTSWTEAKRLLKPDPRYSKMPRKEREALWVRHTDDIIRKQKSVADPKEKERPEREGKIKYPTDVSRRSPRKSSRR